MGNNQMKQMEALITYMGYKRTLEGWIDPEKKDKVKIRTAYMRCLKKMEESKDAK